MEDHSFGGNKPYIDLTPAEQWGEWIEKQVGENNMVEILNHVASRANYTCELCGASKKTKGVMGTCSEKFRVEYRYEHLGDVAILRRIIHVCSGCYHAIHLRQTQLMTTKINKGWPMINALARLGKIHGLSESEILCQLGIELEMWEEKRKTEQPKEIDISILEDGLNRLWS